MTSHSPTLEAAVAEALRACVRACFGCEPPVAPETTFEIPAESALGDLASTLAMKLAKPLRRPPLEIAHRLADALNTALSTSPVHQQVERLDVKPPGFLNLFLTQQALTAIVEEVRQAGPRYGTAALGHGQRVSLEFVSANPTGPLSVAHGRQAAVGDALGRILESVGFNVCREYFLNDEGTQMDLLGQSLYARYLEQLHRPATIPENGYQGSYLVETASTLVRQQGSHWLDHTPATALPTFRKYAIDEMLEAIREDLERFEVRFDRWTSQAQLRADGHIDRAIQELRHRDYVYEAEGALWFKSSALGDEKDRVLRKQDGSWTYVAPDIAYHADKFARKFTRLIDLWGPDHHGYVPRLKAAVQALTGRGADLTILIVQLVTLSRRGVPIPMSTRQGQFVSLREIVQEVGKDAARFLFLTRRIESHLDFDLELAKTQSLDNPVYYVQYAHARICSVLAFARDERAARPSQGNAALLTQPAELAVLRLLRQFPLVVQMCARQLEPYGLTWYLRNLAASFHGFYDTCRVVSDDQALSAARLALVDAVRQVLLNGLTLLGVSAPAVMTRES